MLDNVKKFVLPDTVVTAIRDAIVDKLAEHVSKKKRKWVLTFHSDGKFRNELNTALERAVARFAEEHEDQPFVDAVARNTEFWSLKSVQDAVKEIVIRPSSYLESQFATLRQTFADIAPTVAPERIDAAVHTFLRCISDEVMNIPRLAPIYQLQLEKISLQQGREMVAALKDANEIQQKALIALLEVSTQQNRLLLTGPRDYLQLDEVDLQELKAKYFRSIREKYAVMDLGGISPRVASKTGGRMVSVRMEDVFIPLRAREDFFYGFDLWSREKLLANLREPPLAVHPTLQELPTALETHWQTEDTFAKWIEALQTRLKEQDMDTSFLEILKEEGSNIAEVLDETQEYLYLSRAIKAMKALVGIKKILEHRKVVVLGHPGSGKTTIGKYIAYAVAKGKKELIGERLGTYIPVIVKAAAYGKFLKKEENLSFYRYVTGEKYSDDYGPLFQWALKNNRGLVIIDGLDEVPDAALRMRVAERIEQFVSDYPENQFLVTSRIVGYKGNQLTGNFVHFTLTELEKEQIIVFLENWYKAVTGKKTRTGEEECKQKARELWKDIDAKEGVKKLAGTPLLLTIIALVNYYGSRLPDRRVELYQLATETLLSNWPLKQREQNIDAREILSVLEPIAYQIFTTSEDRLITDYEFRPLFEEQIRKVQGVSARKARTIGSQLLDKIAQDTGFFLSRGTNEKGQDVYGFLHPTFAEYLTARYLADQWLGYRGSSERKLEFAASVHDALWHEVVLLVAGHLGTMADRLATQFVDSLEKLESSYEKYLHRDLLLIAEIIGDNVPVSREKRGEIVSSLISIALDTPYLSLWQSILERLGDIALAFPFINQPKQLKLQENDDIVRRVRKTILSRRIGVQKKADFAILFQGLFADEETSKLAERELASIIEALRKSAKGNAVTHLLAIKRDTGMRYLGIPKQVAEEIKNIPLPIHGVEALVGMGIDFEKKAFLVWLLDLQQISQLGGLRIASLITIFENQSYRYGLTLLLAALDYGKSYVAILNELTKQVSLKEKRGDYQIVLNALEKLISHTMSLRRLTKVSEVAECRETLQSLVMSDEEAKVRAKALKVILLLPQTEKDQLEAIMRGLNDPEKEVRLTAAEMSSRVPLRRNPELQLVDKLRELLADVDSAIRIASARGIIRAERFMEEDILSLLEVICEPPAEPIGKRELRERGVDLIFLANHASQPQSLSTIASQFESIIESDDTIDFSYVKLLQPRTPFRQNLIEIVTKLFSSGNARIRCRAIQIWSHMRPRPSLTPSILLLLKDNDFNAKLAVIEALEPSNLSETEVIDQLIDAIKNGSIVIKLAAIRVLSRSDISHIEVINTLLEALKGDNVEVVRAAASVLSTIKEPEIRQKVVEEASRLVAGSKENKYAFEVLWGLLASTYVKKPSTSI